MIQLYFRTDASDRCLVALGSNLSVAGKAPLEIVRDAMDALDESGIKITRSSRLYHSPAFPPGAGADYVNAVVEVQWESAATSLLKMLHKIEEQVGRTRETRWGARVLDLDLLAAGDQVLPDIETYSAWCDLPIEVQKTRAPDSLILPHPRLHERAFVLVPLCEIAPDWVHPVLSETAETLLAALPAEERDAIVPIGSR